jgi:3-deoxy-7-phosphoheptulonate synthase
MLHQPDPEKGSDMLAGIIAIRHLHLRVIKETGMFTADEMLYPENYQYLYDLLSYIAIGARSVENQQHRLVSSGIEIPVGMKNPTGGDISVMLNSVMAAQHAHTFLYRGWEVKSSGNPLAHTILRGYVNKHGESLPNYHYEDIEHLCAEYAKRGLQNPALIVDCNHANSGKKYKEQTRIAAEVLHSCSLSSSIASVFKGFMIESYIEEGSQKIGEGIYGKSITDPCLGWKDTENFIYYMAEKL